MLVVVLDHREVSVNNRERRQLMPVTKEQVDDV